MTGLPVQRILVADDSTRIRNILSLLLQGRGYQVIEAVDGNEALEKAMSLRPDLILLDVQMPGKSGFEICSYLKANEQFRNIPILMLTAIAQGSGGTDEQWKNISNADGFISKPFQSRGLLDRIVRLLEKQQSGKDTSLRVNPYEIRSDLDLP
jgi:CheY-like chemotaxis protein